MGKTPQEKLTRQRYITLVVMLLLILMLAVGSVVLWILTPRPVVNDPQAPFAVRTVTLEGNTKYREDAVLGMSGVTVGQNLFTVNTDDVRERLLAAFPYFETVDVQTLHMNEVHIAVTETSPAAAVAQNGCWLLFSRSGRVLEQREMRGDLPEGFLWVKGADPPPDAEGDLTVGGKVMDDYCLTIFHSLTDAISAHGLSGVTAMDLSDKNDLRLTWDDRIEIRLGNTSNLDHEIGVVAVTIPKVLGRHGQNASGVLNVSSYSNPALENQAVFTPSSLLPTTTTAQRRPSPGDQTQPSETEPSEDGGGEEE